MCLAIPARIESIVGSEAGLDLAGVGRHIGALLTPEAEVGDCDCVHTGHAISVTDRAEARENLPLLRELAESCAE
jgi:hydrogenase assembly chaperone HypC/HupF